MTLATILPRFDHLDAMTDDHGLFEHADLVAPRLEHGYCTDDNARLLVVCARAPDAGPAARLGRTALAFVLDALLPDGRVRNRMDQFGTWTDAGSTDDCWGRAIWGLGAVATHHDDPDVADRALAGFHRAARLRSRWPRAMAFAALGAAEVLDADPTDRAARALLIDVVAVVGKPSVGAWAWPHPRLSYANAALAEALIVAGSALADADVLDDGLTMLGWLLELETRGGHLSVAPVSGRCVTDIGPRFDQQPIEVAAMADACWRAFELTGEQRWHNGVRLAAAWFDGANDVAAPMRDDTKGGSFDGLTAHGANRNEGAESTLALVSTMQRACALADTSTATPS
jgi:hypothetical protein